MDYKTNSKPATFYLRNYLFFKRKITMAILVINYRIYSRSYCKYKTKDFADYFNRITAGVSARVFIINAETAVVACFRHSVPRTRIELVIHP